MSPIFSHNLQIWHWSRMSKCQKCREEEELAGMACLSCPCSSTFATRTTAELNKKNLTLLDMMQLQNLCVNSNLASIGNRANLIDRLLHRFILFKVAIPTVTVQCSFIQSLDIATTLPFHPFFAAVAQEARRQLQLQPLN